MNRTVQKKTTKEGKSILFSIFATSKNGVISQFFSQRKGNVVIGTLGDCVYRKFMLLNECLRNNFPKKEMILVVKNNPPKQ